MKNKLVVVGVVIATAIIVVVAQVHAFDQEDVVHYGGVIRMTSTGDWEFIDNATHTPVGLVDVTEYENYVEVEYEDAVSSIITVRSDPDEGYIKHNIDCGASGQLDSLRVICAADGVRIDHTDPLDGYFGGSTNIWLEVWAIK